MKSLISVFLLILSGLAVGAVTATYTDGVTQIFNPSNNRAGLNIGSIVSNPATMNNGDMWYATTDHTVRMQINGNVENLASREWVVTQGYGNAQADEVVFLDGSTPMTGALTFSGTTHPGLRLNNLTTTQRDFFTPLAGYTIWNTTTGQAEVYDGVNWVAVGGVFITPPNVIAALVIDVSNGVNTKNIAVDSTFTFSATPTTGAWFSLLITEISGVARTITIPSSYSIARGASITSFTLAASSSVKLDWYYDGSTYWLFGDPTNIGQLTQDTTPASTDLMESWDGTEHRYSTVAQLVAAAGVGGSPTTTRGELIRRGASADEALTIGPLGATFTSDGTDPQWFSRRKWITIYDEEFTKGANYYFSTFTNAFVNVAPPDTTADGVAIINSINYTGVALAGVNQLTFGTGRVIFQARVRMTRLASGGDNTYKIGFGDTTDGSAYTDGVWFSYTDNVNSGNWVANCKAGATSGSTNMSVGPAANTWYWLTIDISADGDTANFYVNEANGVSVTTANSIPDSTSEVCGIEFVGASTSASTNQLYIDHCSVMKLATSNR